MRFNKKAEKVAEAKYDVVYHYPNLDLHSAAISGNVGLVHYALTHGQPVNSILHGLLPIHAACCGGSEQVVRMLIDRGADVNAPRLPRRYLDSKQQSTVLGHAGSTPLHFAAANGHDKIVRILLACGAVQKPDKLGNTPEMIAEEAGHTDIVETLRTWEAMLDEEREKAREREEEEKKALARNTSRQSPSLDSEAIVDDDEDEDEDYISPTLGKSAAWKGKGRAASLTDKEQRIKIRKSLDHMFGGRRGGSLRVSSGKGDKGERVEPKRGESLDLNLPGSSIAEVADKPAMIDDRRSSLPGLFGRVTHPSISLREAMQRKSHASDAGSDIHLFRGRTRTQDSDDSQASGPQSIRHLSKQSLLQLFRRGHNGSPPSLSPSPPRTTLPNLPTDNLDESVDRIKRLSLDGIRPGSIGNFRPRSGSQVNFQNPLVSRSSSVTGSSFHDHTEPPSAPDSTEVSEDHSREENNTGGETEFAAGSKRSLTNSMQSTHSGNGLKPLSRIDTQLANGKHGDEANEEKKDQPKSILKRAEAAPSPTSPRGFARLSPWHEPSTPSPLGGPKPRSATMPTSYFSSPLSPRKPEARKPPVVSEADNSHGSRGNDESPDSDRREKEDGIGESIWDRAAARRSAKGRSRGASLTSIASSAMSGAAQAFPPGTGLSLLSEPEGTDWSLPSHKPVTGQPSIRRYGRSRNNTVSTVSTMASNGAYSTETADSNLTPPSLSSSHFVSGSSVHPLSDDGLSVKERLVRRVSKRRADGPDLLYAVPMKGQMEEPNVDAQLERVKHEAIERRRKTEQEIVRAVSDPRHESTLSLAEQLAAYGDMMAMEAGMTHGSQDNPPSETSSSEQVSRSYIERPTLKKTSSTDSNATIKTENSRMHSEKARKVSSVPVSSTHSREGSLVGSKPPSTGNVVDNQARQEALRLLPSLDTLFTTHAPSAAIPSINRIYENRAAAYRDKGLALIKQAPLYGSSARNPSRPPVKIEDHWLIAGMKQNPNVQARQQRAASLGMIPAPVEREIHRPAISVPMAISHSEKPVTPTRKPSRGADLRAILAGQSKPGLRPATTAKVEVTSSVISPALASARPIETAPVREPTNGTANGKTLANLSSSVSSNARRRGSGLLDNDVVSSLETSPVGSVSKPGMESGPATAKPTKKTEHGAFRMMSGEGDQTPTQTPTSAGSGSMATPLATGHKHRWGDGLKTAMRLGKSRS